MNKYNFNFFNPVSKTAWAVCFLGIMLVGCSTTQKPRTPNFYPNQHLKNVGQEQARHDTRVCSSLADEYVQNPEKWKKATKNIAKNTIIGSAVGAASGALISKAGRGVAAGAIGGVIIGTLNAIFQAGDPNPDHDRFVSQCLAEKGYQVFSWS